MKKGIHGNQADAIAGHHYLDPNDPDNNPHELAVRFGIAQRTARVWIKRHQIPIYKDKKPGRKNIDHWLDWLPTYSSVRTIRNHMTSMHHCEPVARLLTEERINGTPDDHMLVRMAIILLHSRRHRIALARMLAGYGFGAQCTEAQREELCNCGLAIPRGKVKAFTAPTPLLLRIKAVSLEV